MKQGLVIGGSVIVRLIEQVGGKLKIGLSEFKEGQPSNESIELIDQNKNYRYTNHDQDIDFLLRGNRFTSPRGSDMLRFNVKSKNRIESAQNRGIKFDDEI